MPNSKQATKRMFQNERRHLANKSKRSAMRTAIKKVMAATTAEEAQAAIPNAMRAIDKCAKKNIIHDNAAARKKSQLARSLVAKSLVAK